jgi:hypothetical protein
METGLCGVRKATDCWCMDRHKAAEAVERLFQRLVHSWDRLAVKTATDVVAGTGQRIKRWLMEP